MRKTLGYQLNNCPSCKEELASMGVEDGTWEKQCMDCDLIFFKPKGKRWTMKSMWDEDVY